MYNFINGYSAPDGTKKVFEMDFSLEISIEFISCANVQLTKSFTDLTGIKIAYPIWMTWNKEDGLNYTKAAISKLNAMILFGHGIVKTSIVWKSKSGRIYEIADTDIDCNDIEFRFEGLDVEACKLFWKPKWTLLRAESFKDSLISQFKDLGIDASYSFLKCADDQLSAQFYKATGLKSNKNLCLIVPSKTVHQFVDNNWIEVPNEILEVGITSKLKMGLWVATENSDVTIAWQSKSGRIYKMSDTDIDCTDIQFSFEKLETEKYIAQFYPEGQKLPFVLKNLPYELEVVRLNVDCTISITVEQGFENNRETIITALRDFTTKFNDASEKKSDDGEIVKNYLGRTEGDNMIAFEVDMSIAGFDYFKKLLKFIAKTAGISKVQIE